MADQIRVSIIDDHPLFRDGVRRALRSTADIKIVAEGATADDACRIAQTERPDVILLDITMPGNGIEAARKITSEPDCGVRIIMLTGSDCDEQATSALAAGATGFVLKGATTAELHEAIRTVHAGRPYVTPELSSRLLVSTLRAKDSKATQPARQANDELTAREREILNAVVKGHTNSEIARELDLALPTVKNYMSRIFDKLRVKNRAEAVAACLRGGRAVN